MAEVLAFLNRFILALAGFPLVAWLWHREGGGHGAFTGVVMGIPVLFGYLVPGLAIAWLRLWEIRSRFSIRGVQVHQGLVYGSGLALDAWIAWHIRFATPLATALVSALVNGIITAFGGWIIDIAGVRKGRIRIDNPPARAGLGPEAIVTYYAPACYFVLGAGYMLAIHLAWTALVVLRKEGWAWTGGTFLAGFLLASLPIIALYLWLQRREPRP